MISRKILKIGFLFLIPLKRFVPQISVGILTFVLVTTVLPGMAQQPHESSPISNLGLEKQGESSSGASLQLAQRQTTDIENSQSLAQTLNDRGNLEFVQGNPQAALDSWEQAEQYYREIGDELGIFGSKINQAQALQALGLYQRSQKTLEAIEAELINHPDPMLRSSGLRSLGNTLQVLGELERSQDILTQSLVASQELNDPQEIGATLFSLGNTTRARENIEEALQYYQEAAQTTPDPLTQVESQLNLLSLFVEIQQWEAVQSLFPIVESALSQLPPSRSSIYGQINFSQSLLKYAAAQPEEDLLPRIAERLAQAVNQGKKLNDSRATSYGLGQLGKLYEQSQQWQESQKLTEQALILAQGINAGDIAYQWQWQLARLRQAQGDHPGAVVYYNQAFETLSSLRQDLAVTRDEVQFSFRDEVEPFYREFTSLLLTSSKQEKATAKSLLQAQNLSQPHTVNIDPENLQKARQVVEALNLAELDNFFGEACIEANPVPIDNIDPKASVIYPILLPDRLGVILSVPGTPLSYYETLVPTEEVENTLEQFIQFLNPARSNRRRLALAQQIYQWLIQPAEKQFADHQIETLVFVLDSSLSNLPMAALYDGEQYLIENYRVALSSGLQLLNPRELRRPGIEALTGGVSEARQGFIALPGVEEEVKQIEQQVSSRIFLNQEFTNQSIEALINNAPFSVVHLATHGQFSSQADQTFLLTWDNLLKVKEFTELLQTRTTERTQPIELLVLSACQTAKGDDRATLGLAGLAVRSGVRSTLATLWSVNDQSTAELMVKFYQELDNPEISKVEALRQSQLALLNNSNYQHPYFWAPFVLIGNWL